MPTGQPLGPTATSLLRLRTLGAAALTRLAGPDATPEPILGPGKPLALLTYLALSPGRMATREHLADLLWSDLEPERARHSLRQTVWQLRQLLGDTAINGRTDEVRLAVPIETDHDEFIAAVERRELDRAVELYTGPFLPEFAVPGGLEFEQWLEVERTTLRNTFVRAADAQARRLMAAGQTREAQRLARRVRDADPLDERGWRLLIEARFAGGDALGAQLDAGGLVQMLEEEDRGPEPATKALLARVRQADGIEDDGVSGPRGLVADLIGREAEFAAVLAAWEQAKRGRARTVCLEAPAGLGKTRLLQDLRARLILAGAAVTYVRANPGGRQVSYGYACDIAAALCLHPGGRGVSADAARSLVALNPTLSNTFTTAPDPATGPEALRRRTVALAELIQAVSEEKPVALLLDDLHWADAPSVRLLEAVRDRVANCPVLFAGAERAGIGQWQPAGAERIALAPLAPAEVLRLITSLGTLPSEPWADQLAARLHDTSGGSPLLALEALQLGLDQGWLRLEDGNWNCDEPEGLQDQLRAGGALRHRLSRLTDDQRGLLVMLAIAGDRLERATLVQATGRTEDSVQADLVALEANGSIRQTGDRWEPSHDEIAAAAMDTCDPERRRLVHRQLARAFASAKSADLATLQRAALHWHAAGDEVALGHVFARWLGRARRANDPRRSRDLAAELLGQPADSTAVTRLVRRLPIWTRARLGSTRNLMIATAAGALLVIAGGALVAFGNSAPPPDARLLIRLPDGQTRSLDIVDSRLLAGQAIDPATATRRWRGAPVPWESSDLAPHPSQPLWAYGGLARDSGGLDLYLRDADGTDERLTDTPGDDNHPRWSPDGRFLVFTTSRWSNAGWSDVAVMDLATHSVRRLTAGDDYDLTPTWSPDGSRIAFARENRTEGSSTPPRVCWVTVDGAESQCLESGTPIGIVGWADPENVLVEARGPSGTALFRVDLTSGRWTPVIQGMVNPIMSGDGRWAACLCRLAGEPSYAWYVFPMDRPEQARRIDSGSRAPAQLAVTWPAPAPPRFIDRLGIARPGAPIPVDGTYALHARSLAADGESIEAPIVRWASLDTAIATVGPSSGVIQPIRQGRLRVVASAGGWRADTAVLTIGPPGWRTLQIEDWHAEWSRWRPFGDPPPTIVAEDGGHAFWNRGDSTFENGAYSLASWSAREGLGLEATLRVPLTTIHWQYVSLGLVGWVDSAMLAGWDHRTGPLVGDRFLQASASCSGAYPDGEGSAAVFRMAAQGAGLSAGIPIDSSLRQGTPFTVRVQIFPDRRCGVAIDGKAIWVGQAAMAVDRPFRALVLGKSFRTRVLVGPVTVWSGVRRDVDWETVGGAPAP